MKKAARSALRAACTTIESLETRTLLTASPASRGGAARVSTPAAAPITTGAWPTYTQAVADLNTLATTYPSLTKLVNIGSTVQGRAIYAMEITDNPGVQEDEPEFYYQGQIHGDEPIGMYNSFQLMNEMLTNYGGTSATAVRETNLINNMDMWFVPSINWDGYNASTTSSGHRGNANNVDLNRNFPEWTTTSYSNDTKLFGEYGNMYDGPTPNTTGLQVETIATMNFLKAHHFVASVNFHSGDLVVNYPWDTDGIGGVNPDYATSPDDTLFRQMALVYSTQNTPMYNNNSAPFVHGTTNGDNWYPISGGEQDWANIYTGDHQFTIELDSAQKYPPANQLNTYWNNNRESMLQFMEAANWGVRGVVTDVNSGAPLYAKVTITTPSSPTPDSHHPATIPIFTDPAVGDYHRQLLPGTYSVKFEAAGYVTQTISVTFATNSMDPTQTFRRDVQLVPIDTVAPSVSNSAFTYNGSPQTINFTFSEPVQGLDNTDLILHDNNQNTNIASGQITLSNYDSITRTATFSFNYSGGTLPGGSYTASINPAGVSDLSGNALSGGFAYNFIYAAGSSGNDTTYARRSGSILNVWENRDPSVDPVSYSATFSTLSNFDIDGFDGNDSLTLDFTGGEVRPGGAAGFGYRLGTNSETLQLRGPVSWVFATDPAADANNPNLSLVLDSGASAQFDAPITHLQTLDIESSASATVTAGSSRLLMLTGITVGSGTLDLNDNDMIVDYHTASQLATITSSISSARNGGLWDGNGITSTFARNATPKITTLGAMEATDYWLARQDPNALFDGQTLDNTAIVVKYTYYGDANFNGKVDGGDYSHIDPSFNAEHTTGNIGGWLNGDFNYDGRIDGTDYALIDPAFNAQTDVL